MKAYNKKHKKKHTTKVKHKKYEWNKSGYDRESLQIKRVNFVVKGTIKEFSVKLNSIIEYNYYWNEKEFIKH